MKLFHPFHFFWKASFAEKTKPRVSFSLAYLKLKAIASCSQKINLFSSPFSLNFLRIDLCSESARPQVHKKDQVHAKEYEQYPF